MNRNQQTFALYLLGYMRSSALVDRALSSLRAATPDVASARQRVIDLGLERPGATFDDYERFIGRGVRRSIELDNEPFHESALVFRFDTWPGMHVVVHGSPTGVVGGIRFERPTVGLVGDVRPEDLLPWQVVRTDLPDAKWQINVTDRWYPMLDVEVRIAESEKRIFLQFDFDLLQTVELVNRPEIAGGIVT